MPGKPIKLWREANADDFVRTEIERHGFKPTYSTSSTLSKLLERLAAEGMAPSKNQARKLIEICLKLDRTRKAVMSLKNGFADNPEEILGEEVRKGFEEEIKIKKVVWKPYGIHFVLDNPSADWGIMFPEPQKGLEGVSPKAAFAKHKFSPKVKELLEKQELSLEDIENSLSLGTSRREKQVTGHETEHAWSHSTGKPTSTEELAAWYKSITLGWKPEEVFENMSHPDASGNYHEALGLRRGFNWWPTSEDRKQLISRMEEYQKDLEERYATLKEYVREKQRFERWPLGKAFLFKHAIRLREELIEEQKKNCEELERTASRRTYEPVESHLNHNKSLLKRLDEKFSEWFARVRNPLDDELARGAEEMAKKSVERHLEAFKKIISLQTEHGISTNVITNLIRATPIENVPAVLEAANALGKIKPKTGQQKS